MPVIHPVIYRYRLALLLLVACVSACNMPQQQPDNPYQRSIDTSEPVNATRSAPVTRLHNQALAAINEAQYPLAIDYLQRAIKIEPRNPWSWHYLADINWRQGELERCRSMLERSQSYAVNDPQLDDANAMMRAQCQ
jgi:Tfp pilus assembly protein PilF